MFLDASKAFDRINYFKLFLKLIETEMPNIVVRLLVFYYTHQGMSVRWGNYTSEIFTVSNGVRQGGKMSPLLFNFYFRELSLKLASSNLGCQIANVYYNHLSYADDICLLSSTTTALMKLCDIYVDYAAEFDILKC